MADDNQNLGFPDGFLIKDKKGGFKKVQEDGVVDYKPTAASRAPLPPAKPVAVPVFPTALPKQPPADFLKMPAKPMADSTKSALLMDPEDEEDIAQHKENLKQMAAEPVAGGVTATELKAKSLVSSLNIPITEEVYKKRLEKIVELRLKDVRSSIETAEVLSRPKKIGGLELPADLAKKVVAEIDKAVIKTENQPLNVKPQAPVQEEAAAWKQTSSAYAPPPPAFVPRPGQPLPPAAKLVEEPKVRPAPPMPEARKIPVQAPVQPVAEALPPKQEPKPPVMAVPVSAEPAVRPIETPYHPSSGDSDMTKIAKIRRPEQNRPQVVDIRPQSKILGPVEELADIDLKEFRRMGENPKEAAEKILEKIYLLEEESWEMRMNGLDAWRRSPTYKLYVELGRESMQHDKTIKELIQERMNNNQPYIMMEEFMAINDLNSKLNV